MQRVSKVILLLALVGLTSVNANGMPQRHLETESPIVDATDAPSTEDAEDLLLDTYLPASSESDAPGGTEAPTVILTKTAELATESPVVDDFETMAPSEEVETEMPEEFSMVGKPLSFAPSEGANDNTQMPEEFSMVGPALSFAPSEDTNENTQMPEEFSIIGEGVTAPPSESAAEEYVTPPPGATCTENPALYQVMVDIQSESMGQNSAICSVDEDSFIAAKIQAVMNSAFPVVVDNWDGDAVFGKFGFDHSQAVHEAPFARRLRGGGRVPLPGSKAPAPPQRRLQEATCEPRGDLVCLTGHCTWGCLEAATTDCSGDSSFSKWTYLEEDIRAALFELATDAQMRCLGVPGKLRVYIHLGGGDVVASAPEEEEDQPDIDTSAPEEEDQPDIDTTPPVGEEAPEEVPEVEVNRNADIAMSDGEDIVSVGSKLTVVFFEGGSGPEMIDDKIKTFAERYEQLEAYQLMMSPKLGQTFAKLSVQNRKESYDEESRTLVVNFTTKVEFEAGGGRGVNDHTIAQELAKADFHEHVNTLRSYGIGGIESIVLTCTGTSGKGDEEAGR